MWVEAWDKVLELAALILSVINGLILVRVHFRDRAKLRVVPVHPEVYQWWVRLPDGMRDNRPSRRFAFLAYIGISNEGYRAVTLNRWRLEIVTINGNRAELAAISIPEPAVKLGENVKVYPVLGQKGPIHPGEMRVESGDSISGMALYVFECFGPDSWNPRASNRVIAGLLRVNDVFGGKTRTRIEFREKGFAALREIVPDLQSILDTISQERDPLGL